MRKSADFGGFERRDLLPSSHNLRYDLRYVTDVVDIVLLCCAVPTRGT